MRLESEHLYFRAWQAEDAPALFALAKDSRVGPIAGWPPHESVEASCEIIQNILGVPGTYALVLKETDAIVGCISLTTSMASLLHPTQREAEIGYWLGFSYWGMGLMTEAVRTLLRYAFSVLDMDRIVCAYFEGNERSKRVQETCGFRYDHSNLNLPWPVMGDVRDEHVSVLTREEYGYGTG